MLGIIDDSHHRPMFTALTHANIKARQLLTLGCLYFLQFQLLIWVLDSACIFSFTLTVQSKYHLLYLAHFRSFRNRIFHFVLTTERSP